MPTTDAVKVIVVKMMAALLEIFGIMTKETKEEPASELSPDDILPAVDRGSEKYCMDFCMELIRRNGIEDALNRLDRLTGNAIEIMKAAGTEEEWRQWALPSRFSRCLD